MKQTSLIDHAVTNKKQIKMLKLIYEDFGPPGVNVGSRP